LWPDALKREIVAASLEPGASVSVVARRYEVNANQVFGWRKQYRDGSLAAAAPIAPMLVPVTVTSESSCNIASASNALDTIEIELVGKYRVRVGGGFDGKALRRVLDVLERRPVSRSLGEGG
jgi:transposase